jgi:hypothetical protein
MKYSKELADYACELKKKYGYDNEQIFLMINLNEKLLKQYGIDKVSHFFINKALVGGYDTQNVQKPRNGVMLSARVTPEMRKSLEELAKADGISMSGVICDAIAAKYVHSNQTSVMILKGI